MVTSKGEEKRTELPLPHDVKLLFVSLIKTLWILLSCNFVTLVGSVVIAILVAVFAHNKLWYI